MTDNFFQELTLYIVTNSFVNGRLLTAIDDATGAGLLLPGVPQYDEATDCPYYTPCVSAKPCSQTPRRLIFPSYIF
jgi:hypothetical protein